MALVTTNNYHGFQEFDSTDPAIVYKHTLKTDKDTVESGTATMTEVGAGTVTFDSALGMSLTNGANAATDNAYLRVQLTNAADYNPLSYAGCVTFWLSDADLLELTNTKTYNDVFFSWSTAGNAGNIRRAGTTGRILSFVNNASLSTNSELKSLSKDIPVRIDISWTNGIIELYVDKKLIQRNTRPTMAAGIFNDIGVGDRAGSLSAEGVYYSNLMISHRPIMSAVNPSLQRVVIFGDSFATLGNYPAGFYAQAGVQEDGQTGGTFDPSSIIYDSGWAAAFEKELAKSGLFVGGGKVVSWSEGGTGIEVGNTLELRIDEMITAQVPAPTIALIHMGTNDNTSLTEAAITDGTWLASYQAAIDKLTGIDCNKIIVASAPPINVYTAGDTATLKSINLAINVEIGKLVANNSEVYLMDEFSLFGGHNGFNSQDFGSVNGASDDRHPSWYGYTKIGKWFAQAAKKII